MAVSEVRTPTAIEHIHELRRRLSWVVGVLMFGAVLTYVAREPIIKYLQQPLGQDLFYTSPTGSFEFIMQICFLGGFLLALPALIYHLLRFVEPAFRKGFSRGLIITLIVGSSGLTLAGAGFAYYVSLPAALHFFGTVGTGNLKALISIDRYFSFLVSYLAVFAAVFQLPLLLLFIDHIHPLDPPKMGKWRKWVIVGAFSIALVVPSAPDPLSQMFLALPIILLYEVSIGLIRLQHYRQRIRSIRMEAKVQRRAERQAVSPLPVAVVAPTPVMPAAVRPARARVIDLRQASAPQPVRSAIAPTNVLDLRVQSHHAA
jgi:sec-independent protein translocase protein TatC